ncbi:hypothetical protein [Desulfuromonas sp.]|nr:hypothetical protein [Desulfuromonas sp.]
MRAERAPLYIEINIPWRTIMEILGLLGFFAAWYILNKWILPRLGVQT